MKIHDNAAYFQPPYGASQRQGFQMAAVDAGLYGSAVIHDTSLHAAPTGLTINRIVFITASVVTASVPVAAPGAPSPVVAAADLSVGAQTFPAGLALPTNLTSITLASGSALIIYGPENN